MIMNRRTVLLATTAIGVVILCPSMLYSSPILYGDGKHDDTQALTAIFKREPYQLADTFSGRVYNDSYKRVIVDGIDHSVKLKIQHLLFSNNFVIMNCTIICG